MAKALTVSYGLISYGVFFISVLYAIGFVGDFAVPRTVDSGPETGIAAAFIINMVLLGIFALQHSIMARPGFKKEFTKVIPKQIERSTYVLASSILLLVIFRYWQPIPMVVWEATHPALISALTILFWVGWAMVFLSTFLIDHFDLFGLRQVFLHLKNRDYVPVGFKTESLYRIVRHPIMLGFIIAFWATPRMTLGHLMFAAVTTAYILIGIQFEERDLKHALGKKYETYQECVPGLVPFSKRLKKEGDHTCSGYHLFGDTGH